MKTRCSTEGQKTRPRAPAEAGEHQPADPDDQRVEDDVVDLHQVAEQRRGRAPAPMTSDPRPAVGDRRRRAAAPPSSRAGTCRRTGSGITGPWLNSGRAQALGEAGEAEPEQRQRRDDGEEEPGDPGRVEREAPGERRPGRGLRHGHAPLELLTPNPRVTCERTATIGGFSPRGDRKQCRDGNRRGDRRAASDCGRRAIGWRLREAEACDGRLRRRCPSRPVTPGASTSARTRPRPPTSRRPWRCPAASSSGAASTSSPTPLVRQQRPRRGALAAAADRPAADPARRPCAAASMAAQLDPLRAGPDVVVLSEENILGVPQQIFAEPFYPQVAADRAALASLGRRAERAALPVDPQLRHAAALGLCRGAEACCRRSPAASRRSGRGCSRGRRAGSTSCARIRAAAPGVPLRIWRQEDYRANAAAIMAALCGLAPLGPLPEISDPAWTRSPASRRSRAAEALPADAASRAAGAGARDLRRRGERRRRPRASGPSPARSGGVLRAATTPTSRASPASTRRADALLKRAAIPAA